MYVDTKPSQPTMNIYECCSLGGKYVLEYECW